MTEPFGYMPIRKEIVNSGAEKAWELGLICKVQGLYHNFTKDGHIEFIPDWKPNE